MRALLLRDTWCVLLLCAWVAHGVVMYLGGVMADAVDGVVTFNINQEKSCGWLQAHSTHSWVY